MLFKYAVSEKFETKDFVSLNYKKEFEIIQKTLNSAKVQVCLHKIHGTLDLTQKTNNLNLQLEKLKPGALHFSGHGVTAEEIEADNRKFMRNTMMSEEQIA